MGDLVDQIRQRILRDTANPVGLSEHAPASASSAAAMAADEGLLGFALPPLLKRLYVEVGNGGWGPGYGLLGLSGGTKDDLGETAVASYLSRREWVSGAQEERWPAGLLPICHWGCAIYSCVDCLQAGYPVVCFDPNLHNDGKDWSDALFAEGVGFEDWIALWAEGCNLWQRLYGDDGLVGKIVQDRKALRN